MGDITSKTDLQISRFGTVTVTPHTDNEAAKPDVNSLDGGDDGERAKRNPRRPAEPHARQHQLLRDSESIRKNIEERITRQSNSLTKDGPITNSNLGASNRPQTAPHAPLQHSAPHSKSHPAKHAPPSPPAFQSRSTIDSASNTSTTAESQNSARQKSDVSTNVRLNSAGRPHEQERDSDDFDQHTESGSSSHRSTTKAKSISSTQESTSSSRRVTINPTETEAQTQTSTKSKPTVSATNEAKNPARQQQLGSSPNTEPGSQTTAARPQPQAPPSHQPEVPTGYQSANVAPDGEPEQAAAHNREQASTKRGSDSRPTPPSRPSFHNAATGEQGHSLGTETGKPTTSSSQQTPQHRAGYALARPPSNELQTSAEFEFETHTTDKQRSAAESPASDEPLGTEAQERVREAAERSTRSSGPTSKPARPAAYAHGTLPQTGQEVEQVEQSQHHASPGQASPEQLDEEAGELQRESPRVSARGSAHPKEISARPAFAATESPRFAPPGAGDDEINEDGLLNTRTGRMRTSGEQGLFTGGEASPARHASQTTTNLSRQLMGAVDDFTTHGQTAKLRMNDLPSAGSGASQVIRNERSDGAGFISARSIVDYLSGSPDGRKLSPEVPRTLELIVAVVGREAARNFVEKHGEQAVTLIEQFIKQAGDRCAAVNPHQPAAFRPDTALEESHTLHLIDQLTSVLQLSKQFDKLEKVGGGIVRQAEAAVISFLCGETLPSGQRPASAAELMAAAELRRDLCAGAFLPAYELHNPFPLTGRARVATEMMELMRTLDAVDRALRELEAGPRSATTKEGGSGTFQAGSASDLASKDLPAVFGHSDNSNGASEGEAEPLGTMPALPGRAGRDEMARFLSSLNVLVKDASGEPLLVAEDKTPLKLDQLLWLSTDQHHALVSRFETNDFPTRLSPLLLYGFDAVYSLIGFDGRTLAAPHFATVQAQINGAEFEWVYGQPPLSEGWTRAMIERLKDSVSTEHNVLGEMLEEALADGRFHTLVMRGIVEQGVAASGSFTAEKWGTEPRLAYL